MKRKTIKIILGLVTVGAIITVTTIVANKKIEATETAYTDIINMAEVTSYTEENGVLKLNFMNGDMYSLCAPKVKEKTYVYPICNVLETYHTETGTILVCVMPNGELHAYEIEDAPEGKVELVCFKTDNQDDYTCYEVVGVR